MANRYWVGGNGTWDLSTTSNWATSSGGISGASVPTSSDDVFFNGSSGAGSVSVAASVVAKSITCTGFTGSIDDGGGEITVSGSVVLGSGMSSTDVLFTINATASITCNGKSFRYFIINGSGITVTFQDNFTSSSVIDLVQGTLNANNFNVTCYSFNSAYTNTRTLTMGSGTWTVSGDWDCSTSTNLTLNANTSTIKMTGTGAKSFYGGSKTYNNFWHAPGSGTGTLTITGTNTFNDFKDTGTAAHTITFPNVTTTVSTWNVSGSSGKLITLQRTGASGTWTISDASGTNTSDYLSISNSTATGGATWNPGANSVNGGGNTGWNFLNFYTISIGQGSFSLTGKAATLSLVKKVIAAQGSFTLTGQTVNLKATRSLPISFGSFSLTGKDVNVITTRVNDAGVGYVTLTGKDSNPIRYIVLLGTNGSISLTGNAANLLLGYKTAVENGSITITGKDAILKKDSKVIAEVSSFTLSGQDTLLIKTSNVPGSVGSYNILGQEAGLTSTRVISCSHHTFTTVNKTLNANQGEIFVTGQQANLVYKQISSGSSSDPNLHKQVLKRIKEQNELIMQVVKAYYE